MPHNYTPKDLNNDSQFQLIEKVSYQNIREFIFKEIGIKSKLIRIYGLFQLLAFIVILVLVGYYGVLSIRNHQFSPELIAILLAGFLSVTLLIVIHELIHAAAFLLLGKKNIAFGMQWKRFIFYAESNLQVLSGKQITMVALFPFILLSIAGIIGAIISSGPQVVFWLTLTLVHVFFCSGDFTIVSFIIRHKNEEIYTYDDRSKKMTFYFKKNKNVS